MTLHFCWLISSQTRVFTRSTDKLSTLLREPEPDGDSQDFSQTNNWNDKIGKIIHWNLSLFIISINLLVVYRESANLIGYITRRLSADSLYLLIVYSCEWPMKIGYFEHVKLVSHLSAHPAQCLKPLNCRCKHNKTFFPKRYLTFLCNETTGKFILKQLDYSPSFSTSDSQLGCASFTICL